jgi:hypothetical protein
VSTACAWSAQLNARAKQTVNHFPILFPMAILLVIPGQRESGDSLNRFCSLMIERISLQIWLKAVADSFRRVPVEAETPTFDRLHAVHIVDFACHRSYLWLPASLPRFGPILAQ